MGKRVFNLPSFVFRILHGILLVLIPGVVVLGSVRFLIVTAKCWIPIEYRMPGFPDDPYGFTIEDRIRWSAVDVEFLLNDAGLEYFDAFRLDSNEPMHNERELRHMQDVKILVQQSWLAFRFGLPMSIVLLFLIGYAKGAHATWMILRHGALATAIFLAVFFGVTLFGFGVLFVAFHQVFFEGETWLFPYSDTFIRLYPERFWRDVFILLAGLTILHSGLLYWISSRLLGRSREASAEAQRE